MPLAGGIEGINRAIQTNGIALQTLQFPLKTARISGRSARGSAMPVRPGG